jgi:hypothetical protein
VLLRKTAEQALFDMVVHLFGRLHEFSSLPPETRSEVVESAAASAAHMSPHVAKASIDKVRAVSFHTIMRPARCTGLIAWSWFGQFDLVSVA